MTNWNPQAATSVIRDVVRNSEQIYVTNQQNSILIIKDQNIKN